MSPIKQALIPLFAQRDAVGMAGVLREHCAGATTLDFEDSGLHETTIVWRKNGPDQHFVFVPRGCERTGVLVVERFVDMLPFFEGSAPFEGSRRISLNDETLDDAFGFCSARDDIALLPDPVFVGTLGYLWHARTLKDLIRPFEERIGKAVWRGSTTGQASSAWDLPRTRLCMLAKESPDLLDAAFASVCDRTQDEEAQLRAAGLVRNYMTLQETAPYRYQIDIDGHTNSWPGLMTKLHTGAVVLKVTSPKHYRQWYYDRLRPWGNYVPISPDMGELVAVIELLERNPKLAKDIADAGLRLARSMTLDGEIRRSQAVLHAPPVARLGA